ncbi:MAG: hypothetical protein ABIH37_04400 [archaeon]
MTNYNEQLANIGVDLKVLPQELQDCIVYNERCRDERELPYKIEVEVSDTRGGRFKGRIICGSTGGLGIVRYTTTFKIDVPKTDGLILFLGDKEPAQEKPTGLGAFLALRKDREWPADSVNNAA